MDFKNIISKMTLEEKCSLLSGEGNFTTKAVKRLGIPSMFLSDGPHGIRKQEGAADHLGLNASRPATCFPTAATVANSWDEGLAEEIGKMLGEEAAAQGVSVLLGPALNMKRSPLCGRNFEYFSEDPYLAGKIAAAYIRGIQSKGVGACPKHFAANNQETLRMHNDSVVDERTFREIYLTAFEIAVKEGNPLAIMSAYNRINGVYANENKKLLSDILVDEWGFSGIVVTDWGASNDWADGIAAGSHLEMPATDGNSDRELADAVRSGKISEELLDKRVEEYLKVLFATVIPENTPDFDKRAHHAFAMKAAEESIVLLKNENGLLPLKKGAKVAVIGDFADKPRYQGAGSSLVNPTFLEEPLNALKSAGIDVIGFEGGFLRNGGEDEAKKAAAVELAKRAEIVLYYMGLDELNETEGMDRTHMRIRQNQIDVLEAVAKENPNVIAVLCGGAPFETPWWGLVKGAVHGYLGGQAGAAAMARILAGKANPSGKLAETWPLRYEDTPAFNFYPGTECTSEYREALYIGYRYYLTAKIPVRFPFGFGLSYTLFEYSDLKADAKSVEVTVKNTGNFAGAEIVQVYVSKKGGEVFRPEEELKAFAKVWLEAGESKRISIALDDKAFRYFNVVTGKYEIEGGTYEIRVGASSTDIRLCAEVKVDGTAAPCPYKADEIPSYYSGKVSNVSTYEFENLLGRHVPESKWDRTKPLGRNDTVSQLCYAKSPIARLAHKIILNRKNKMEQKGTPDLNILFIYNIPFRGIAKMMGGAVDMAMVDALLEIVNGHFFKGAAHLISAFVKRGKAAKETARKLANAGRE
ncbi:MAG TPA: glycoside hydrolase family 3 C-terminal domain-containing protein [Oscillospiraceae bacterium]|nr:glycoside hydrolase family 3 C-terminal domain-containing protein [Oscillospiraceae bacterium]